MIGNTPRNHKIIALFLFGFSLFYFLGSSRLKMGTLKIPGPGLIPAVIGGLLVFCSGFYLYRVVFQNRREKVGKEGSAEGDRNYRAIAGVLACTLIYPFILEPLKFILATFSAGFLMLFLLRPRRPFSSGLLALSLAVGAFLIFSRLFGVAFPSGFLENFIFRIGG
jgi:hypothetical protein